VLVAVLLLAVLLWGGVRLGLRLKRQRFGSRLLVKLAGIFAIVGVVPGLVIYTVSYQFVTRSIESWFDVKVEGALAAGVSLARVTLDTVANDMAQRTLLARCPWWTCPTPPQAWCSSASVTSSVPATGAVERQWPGRGQCGPVALRPAARAPGGAQWRSAREQRIAYVIEGLDDLADPAAAQEARVKTLVHVPSARVGLLQEPRFLQASLPLSRALVANAVAVQEANREYQERALARGGLKRMYVGTLTLSLFLAVFGAVLLAVLLGNHLARPLLVLAEGVREVAQGDLRPKAALHGRDELGGLTRSFALMTQQLADARGAALNSMAALDAARANLQTILDNLTAAVLVLDATGRVHSANPGATRILRVPLAAYVGQPLAEVPELQEFAQAVQEQFARLPLIAVRCTG